MTDVDVSRRAPSTRGPWILVVAGVVALLLAVGVGALSVAQSVRMMPLGILTLGGDPGSDVLAVVDLPGAVSVDLDAGKAYGLLLVVPTSQAPGWLDGPLAAVGPSGEELTVTQGASISLKVSSGGQSGHLAATVRPSTTGTHDLTLPAPGDGTTGRVFVIEIPEAGAFVTGIFGGVLGIVVAVFLGIAGAIMLAGGLVWRVVRRGIAPPASHPEHAPPVS